MSHRTPVARGTAVVIGAGVAGLAAARTLADRFRRVVVVDRDELPGTAQPRRGVPQGPHSHVLLAAGQIALEQLFPGMEGDFVKAGAVVFDSGLDLHLYRLGAAWEPVQAELPFVSMSRPLLEHTLRRRVGSHANVVIRDRTAVSALTGAAGRVTGVTLDGSEQVETDLVVDCSGRGSRSDRWLAPLGFRAPQVVDVRVDVGYVSRLYRRTPGDLAVSAAFVQPTPPHEKRIGAALRIEDECWLVSVGGWHGDYPPADEHAFLRHAESLPDPIIAGLVSDAQPLTEPVPYHFPSNRRRLFEQLDSTPAGYVAMGDTVCSFNPLYGQGMTCAAQEAQALGRILDEFGEATSELAQRFYQAVAEAIFVPWHAAISSDFDFPETTGAKPPAVALFGRYATQVQQAAQISGEVRKLVLSVQHLLTAPTALWKPEIVAHVVAAARRGSDGVPEFGYGRHRRPLWTQNDRDAEAVREALRSGGLPEFSDQQLGFAVEGGDPILAACTDQALLAQGGLETYARAISAAGFHATPEAGDPATLRVVREPR